MGVLPCLVDQGPEGPQPELRGWQPRLGPASPQYMTPVPSPA